MTQDEIIEMARKASTTAWCYMPTTLAELEAFAKLVEAKERESCAMLCDDKVDAEYATGKVDHNEMGWTQSCAIAIRARGQA